MSPKNSIFNKRNNRDNHVTWFMNKKSHSGSGKGNGLGKDEEDKTEDRRYF